ncbi:MAG: MBL fold metallo-hydrolase [Thermoanaerobaculia bacterium]|nr:MBL fold metallo-hydrolase [Thermoanaerobaculia bacterium]
MEEAHAACEICRSLRPVETSLYKEGREGFDTPLPLAARRLVELAVPGRDEERLCPWLCPRCGTLYSYESRYEYLANGSEDEEELRRLTEGEARAWLGDALVDELPRPLLAPLHETVVNERVVVWSTGGEDLRSGWGANAVAVLGDGETLLVDPLVAPAYAREVFFHLATRRALPVKTVVATHHHSDHSVGASVFAARCAQVVAHAVAAERMAAEQPALLEERKTMPGLRWLFADAVPAVPTRVVTAPLELSVGGVRAVVRPCGPAHTPGDLRVDLPDLGVVVTGDLAFHGYHPNLEHADLDGWRRALEELLAEPAGTTFVPGHGAPGGHEIVEAQLVWFDAAAEEVRRAAASGLGNGEAVERLRARFPGHRLEAVLPTAVRVLADAT